MLEQLKKQSEKSKSKVKFDLPKTSKFRKVRLKFHYNCDCGTPPYDVEIERVVPEDSPFQDGDYITEDQFEENDNFIF